MDALPYIDLKKVLLKLSKIKKKKKKKKKKKIKTRIFKSIMGCLRLKGNINDIPRVLKNNKVVVVEKVYY